MLGVSVATNTLSLLMQANLGKTTNSLAKSMDRLSTGKKINSAADGAAELSISEKLSSQISGTVVAQENVQHGVLMLNQTDSALQSINSNLTKIRDLAVKASNGTYSQAERDAMKIEAQGYIEQINNIAKTTSFNGLVMLDGSVADLNLQVGANSSETMDISAAFIESTASALGISADSINTAFSSAEKANEFIETVDSAMAQTSSRLATVGSYTNSLSSMLDNLSVKEMNLTSSRSLIMDVDYAKEISKYVQLQILQEVDASLLTQANTQPAIALGLLK